MVRDILLNPAPISEHPDILKKLKILNYVLGEWNDEYDRMQQKADNKKYAFICWYESYLYT